MSILTSVSRFFPPPPVRVRELLPNSPRPCPPTAVFVVDIVLDAVADAESWNNLTSQKQTCAQASCWNDEGKALKVFLEKVYNFTTTYMPKNFNFYTRVFLNNRRQMTKQNAIMFNCVRRYNLYRNNFVATLKNSGFRDTLFGVVTGQLKVHIKKRLWVPQETFGVYHPS